MQKGAKTSPACVALLLLLLLICGRAADGRRDELQRPLLPIDEEEGHATNQTQAITTKDAKTIEAMRKEADEKQKKADSLLHEHIKSEREATYLEEQVPKKAGEERVKAARVKARTAHKNKQEKVEKYHTIKKLKEESDELDSSAETKYFEAQNERALGHNASALKLEGEAKDLERKADDKRHQLLEISAKNQQQSPISTADTSNTTTAGSQKAPAATTPTTPTTTTTVIGENKVYENTNSGQLDEAHDLYLKSSAEDNKAYDLRQQADRAKTEIERARLLSEAAEHDSKAKEYSSRAKEIIADVQKKIEQKKKKKKGILGIL